MDLEVKESLNIMKEYYANGNYDELLKKNYQIIGACEAFKKMSRSQREKDIIDLIYLETSLSNFIIEDIKETKKMKKDK